MSICDGGQNTWLPQEGGQALNQNSSRQLYHLSLPYIQDDDDDDDVSQGSNIFSSCPNVSKIIPKMIAGFPFCQKGKIAENSRKLILGIHPNSAEA